MSVILVETTSESMTFAWGLAGVARQVEIKVNEQAQPTTASVSGGLVRKKNVKAGDKVELRITATDGSWGPWHSFEHDGSVSGAPAPLVSIEVDGEDPSNASALLEFKPIPNCSRYEVAMFPLDGHIQDWISISNSLTNTVVRKKHLRSKVLYSFKYRGMVSEEWGNWSAASFPETAREGNPILNRVLTNKLMRTDGSTVNASSLNGKVIALYFSAHWCPPCRGFTPKLVEFYRTMKAMGKPFEVVFVSADHDQSSFQQYFQEMGWLAIPYDDPRREELQAEHGIRGIPSLKILSSKTGKVVEPDAIQYPLTPTTLDSWQARM